MVAFHLVAAHLIKVRGMDEYHRGIPSVLPIGFTETGWKFVEIAKDTEGKFLFK